MVYDGLTDVYSGLHMGNCAENTAKMMNITRDEQDEFAINSYKRSAQAYKDGAFTDELVPVSVKQRKGKPNSSASVGKVVVLLRAEHTSEWWRNNELYRILVQKHQKVAVWKPVFDMEG